MINRRRYTDKLITYRDNDFVKVITGVRRSGKSSLLSLFKKYLLEHDVEEKQIIEINYEKFVFENIGNNTSANAIKNTMVSHGHKITSDTVDNYLQLMCDAHMLYQCERYDIRGKERLKTNGKYYVVDTGLRNRLIGYRQGNVGHVIENIVFLQLVRLGYEVMVGKNMSYEVDFIAVKETKRYYFKVSLTALDENTYDREMNSLLKINDQYPKYLITMDKIDLSRDGIIHLNFYDFLLERSEFNS